MSGGKVSWLIFGVLVFGVKLNFKLYLSNCYIRVVTPSDSSDLHPVTAGVPQGAIWSPPLFNLYIRKLLTVVEHS